MSTNGKFNVIYDNRLPPCNAQCPSGHDIQGWMVAAAAGDYRQSWEIMMRNNPLPSAMGRVCYHTCEGACNRKDFDQAVNIHAVERFIGDLALAEGWSVPVAPASGKKVLIIGAGPGGLSAAYHLARLGHKVTLAEAGPRAGGMMAFGIPSYRLPRHVLDGEVRRIVDMGVELKLNTAISDIREAMQLGGFDACFSAVGAHLAKRLDIPVTDGQAGSVEVLDAVAFLRAMEISPRDARLGRKVVVYGGGNTAIDVARTAVRLGAEEVRIVYRRSREKMPAHAFEVEEALEEGVLLSDLRTIQSLGQGSMVLGRMELDASGWPQDTGETEILAVDTVVLALGQDVDADPFRALPGVEVNKDGTIKVGDDLQTGAAGVFAGGDMIPFDRTVTVAIGHGKKAARHIDAWLRGVPWETVTKKPIAHFDRINQMFYPRVKATNEPHIAMDARCTTFAEVVGDLDVRIALKEARRCLSCGNCMECDDCLTLCPDKAITRNPAGGYFVDQEKCRECGLCVAQCPCGAIHMQEKTAIEAA